MSKDLILINSKIQVGSFFGGDSRGVCCQITADSGFVQLTASEIIAAIPALKYVIDCELIRKKSECEQAIKENQELLKTIVKDMRDVAEMACSQKILEVAALLTVGAANVEVIDL